MVEGAARRTARERAGGGATGATRSTGRAAGERDVATARTPSKASRTKAPRSAVTAEGGSGSPTPQRRTPARLWNSFLRNRSVRVRVLTLLAVPLLAASLLGGLLLGRAVQDALRAQRAADLTELTRQALAAAHAVQDERDETALRGVSLTSGIEDIRTHTDQVVNQFEAAASTTSTSGLPASTEAAIDTAVRRFGELETVRQGQDYQQTPFDTGGVQGYVAPVRAVTDLLSQLSIVDPRLAVEVEGLTTLNEAAELASTERGLTAWVLQRGEVPTAEQKQALGALQDGQDTFLDRVYDRLPSGPLADFKDGLAVVRAPMSSARLTVAQATTPGELAADEWYRAATDRLEVMRGTQDSLMDEVVDASESRAESARLTAIITLVGLLVVLVLAVVLTLAVARSIVRPLRTLQAAALRTAKKDLPELVERVHDEGPKAVRSADSGLRPEGDDEIGRVASAFNEVYATAVRVTGEQALLRQNLDSIVVNLSRRTQSLVDRQLREIETLEGSERDPDQLATLFRIDHLATRVQRHAESLLVLAGVDSSTKSPEPVPLLDVVRAAAGEVEQYDRVRFGVLPTDLIAARAVDDVAHLLAELLDNATEFSPPATTVLVDSDKLVGGALRVTVTDQGLGVPAARLAELNERLASPGEIDVAASRTLGLYVVARLASRHGIAVRLEAQSTGGTVARIDIPASIVDSGQGAEAPDGAVPALAGAAVGASGAAGSDGGWMPGREPFPGGLTELPHRAPGEHRPDVGRPGGLPGRGGDGRPPGRPDLPVRERRVVDRPGSAERGTDEQLPHAGGNGLPSRGTANGLPQRGAAAGSGLPQRGASGLPQRGAAGSRPGAGALSAAGAAGVAGAAAGAAGGTGAGALAGAGAAGTAGAAGASGGPGRATPAAEDPLTDPGLHVEAQAGGGEQESPIYSALRSSWFRRANVDGAGDGADESAWSSPADEGWRQAEAVSRYTASVSAALTGSAALPRNGTAPAPETRRPPAAAIAAAGAEPPVGAAPAPGAGSPGPTGTDPAEVAAPAQTDTGLPVRQRGASLVPGAIAASRAPEGARDATSVRSTLSTLVSGVARGREAARTDEPADDGGEATDAGTGPGPRPRPEERNDT